MAKSDEPEISLSDLLKQASSTLLQSSVKPNMLMYEPHPKQYKFHCSVNREKLFIGGNRSGKTVANVMECIWWITKKHPHRPDVNNRPEPIRGRLVCVSFVDGLEKIILPLFKQFLPESELVNGEWDKSYNKYMRTLTLANGSFIEFMSYDQELEKFAGTSRHFCCFDEEPPQAIFIECRMRLIDTKGSWWISMTPVEGMTWIYDDIYEPTMDGNKDTFIIEIINTENPHIDAEEVELAMRGLSDSDKAARREGAIIQIGGRVFPSFGKKHIREDFILRPDMRIYTSFDHGWRHPAAWLWHAVEPNGHITTFHEIIVSEKTIAELAREVHEYEKGYLEPKGHSVYLRPADPATLQTSGINGMSIVSTYAEHGIYLAVENIPRQVDIGIDKMQQYLKEDARKNMIGRPYWEIYNCPILSKQMERIRWEKYSSRKLQYENAPRATIHKKDDDGPDSARYFFTLMPDLAPGTYREENGEKPNPLGAVPYATPENTFAGGFGEMLAEESDYQVFESDLVALEGY